MWIWLALALIFVAVPMGALWLMVRRPRDRRDRVSERWRDEH